VALSCQVQNPGSGFILLNFSAFRFIYDIFLVTCRPTATAIADGGNSGWLVGEAVEDLFVLLDVLEDPLEHFEDDL
jgi:hypothetical protein